MGIEEGYAKLRTKRGFRAGSPAAEAEITRIEELLGITLIRDYRAFLQEFGYVRWFGRALYGVFQPLIAEPPSFDYDTVRHTLRARAEPLPSGFAALPAKGNVIDRYDPGGYYFLFSEDSATPGVVALIDHEQMGAFSQTWPSFEEFMASLTR